MITKIPVQSVLLALLLKLVYSEDESTKHGQWSEWGSFSPCSATCGSGTYQRSRHWSPSPNEPASLVNFTSTQELPCSIQGHMFCPVHGNWGYWSGWSACSSACGGGTTKRTRMCTSPRPSFGGNPCKGESWEGDDCNKIPCPPLPAHFNLSACSKSDFMCKSGKMCIINELFCDDIVQCHDGSDEDRCYSDDRNAIGSVRYKFSKGASQSVYLSALLTAMMGCVLVSKVIDVSV